MKSIVELTDSARAHAERLGLLGRLQRLALGAWTSKGDLVVLDGTDQAAFIVRSRRIEIAADGTAVLVLVLDYPPRPAGL